MPIDVNKIIPNKNLALIDGILKGVSGMKKAEEEKQQSFIKNMFEQYKLQQENRKIDIDERKVLIDEQRMNDEFQYKNAMLENAYKEIDIKIANQTLDERKFAQAVTEAGFPYLEKKQEIMNNPKFSQEEKIVRLTAEQKLINDEMLEKRKAETAQLLEDKRQTGRMEVAGATSTSREKIANAQMANQSAIAGMNRAVDLQIADMNITSKESISKAKGELKGNANVDIGNYNKTLLEFNTDYTRQLEIAGDKVDKIKPDVMSRLSSKLENVSSTHQALREMYPDRYITPPNLEMVNEEVKAHWYGGTKQITTFKPSSKLTPITKSAPVTQRNTGFTEEQMQYNDIMQKYSSKEYRDSYTKEELRSTLKSNRYTNDKAVERALKAIYNE